MSTHYDVLGLAPGADDDIIKAAYRVVVKRLHPDRGGDPQQMARVNEAYAVLSDPARRRDYDRELVTHGPATTAGTAGFDDDVVDPQNEVFTDASWDTPHPWSAEQPVAGSSEDPGWVDAEWEPPAPQPEPRPSWSVEPTGSLVGFASMVLLWTMSLVALGAILVGGVVNDVGWGRIAVNVALLATVIGVNFIAVGRRTSQPRFFPPSVFYVLWLLVLTGFGLGLGGALGWACLVWAAATCVLAETER